MQVKIIETPERVMIQMTDPQTMIGESSLDLVVEIQAFGTMNGLVRVFGNVTTVDVVKMLGEELCGDCIPLPCFGGAFVWMEPMTWAYAIRDLLRNQ